ncbi:hypothetical protein G6L44_26260 [Agrobacterium rubi]|nr:hypothetical protein [Agrobacterium rubi]
MAPRYALRMELADSTLEEAFHFMSRKDWAIAAARRIAANHIDRNVVRVWVDDTTTELGIASFEVCRELDDDNS